MKKSKLSRRQFVKSTVAGAIAAGSLDIMGQGVRSAEIRSSAVRTEASPEQRGVIIQSDMSRCLPTTALSRSFEENRWQLIDYETVDGVKGTMVSAMPEANCGQLTLPLRAEGWHRIYLGVNYTNSPYRQWPDYGQLEVKLTGDTGFYKVAAEDESLREDGSLKLGDGQEIYKSVQEAYWRTADLTGKSLVFRQPQAPYRDLGRANLSNLSYVKLVPLNPVEEQEWKGWQTTSDTRRLGIIFCTGALSGHLGGTSPFHPATEDWFKDEFQPYTEGDFKLFICEVLRGNLCLFKTKIGDMGTEDNRWPDAWVDPLAAFTRLAHDNGIKIFASLRMIGPQYPTNREPIARARHYWEHREWTKRDREGLPVANLSLGFPGVRQYWLGLLREALAYGIDGIQLHLNRSTPFVLYEEPVVQAFQKEHREDPRKLPSDDPRWLAHCAGYLTNFVREVRALLDEEPGRDLGVTVFGPSDDGKQALRFRVKSQACDVETWLREGLVNYVMPSKQVGLGVLKRWRNLAGSRAHLWPDLMPRAQPAESYARLAKTYYEAGADGFCLWESECRHPCLSEWAAAQRLGHRQLLDRIIQQAPSWYRRVPLKILGGFSVQDSFRDG